jgi:putative Ca2+/H+ antiporter (TMEM165/GDT1 family)
MGDRSQISAVALAANYQFWIVAFAGSVGHIFALILAILFGKAVSTYTNEK